MPPAGSWLCFIHLLFCLRRHLTRSLPSRPSHPRTGARYSLSVDSQRVPHLDSDSSEYRSSRRPVSSLLVVEEEVVMQACDCHD